MRAAVNDYHEASAGDRPRHEPLAGAVTADACVVGGGLTGLSAALHLAERGYSVAVLEAARIGDGASGRNGGQVGSGLRLGVLELERRFGADDARALWALCEEAKAIVADRIQRHDIACHYRPGNLLAITRERYVPELAREAEHLASRYGYSQLEMLDRGEMNRRVASTRYVAGRLDRGGGHLHPLRYTLGLARAAAAAGVRLFEHSRAVSLQWGRPTRVRTDGGAVHAPQVLLCGNAYLGDTLEPRIAGRIMPVTSYMLATEPLDGALARSLILDECCVHDTRFAVRYFRRTPDHRLLFGGGETYTARPPRDLAGFVRRHMLDVFPQLGAAPIAHAWGGRLAVTANRLPDLGRAGAGGWYAHGFSGHGVALSQLAGRLLAEAVAGDAERFDILARIPHARFPGGRWLRHPLLVLAMLWYALRDHL